MTVQLLKEQIKYDEMPSGLLDHLQRILPSVEMVADENVCEETKILGKIMSQMLEVMQNIAIFLCEYIKRGRSGRRFLFWIPQVLMIAEDAGAALLFSKDKHRIKELDEELANVAKHFLNAVDVDSLRLARRIGKHPLAHYSVRPFLIALCRTEASTQAA